MGAGRKLCTCAGVRWLRQITLVRLGPLVRRGSETEAPDIRQNWNGAIEVEGPAQASDGVGKAR